MIFIPTKKGNKTSPGKNKGTAQAVKQNDGLLENGAQYSQQRNIFAEEIAQQQQQNTLDLTTDRVNANDASASASVTVIE